MVRGDHSTTMVEPPRPVFRWFEVFSVSTLVEDCGAVGCSSFVIGPFGYPS